MFVYWRSVRFFSVSCKTVYQWVKINHCLMGNIFIPDIKCVTHTFKSPAGYSFKKTWQCWITETCVCTVFIFQLLYPTLLTSYHVILKSLRGIIHELNHIKIEYLFSKKLLQLSVLISLYCLFQYLTSSCHYQYLGFCITSIYLIDWPTTMMTINIDHISGVCYCTFNSTITSLLTKAKQTLLC
jgi:hypothetical protein